MTIRAFLPPLSVAGEGSVVKGSSTAFGLDVKVGRIGASGVHHGLGRATRYGAPSEVGNFRSTGRV